jgi:quinol monooxygenase YgiN
MADKMILEFSVKLEKVDEFVGVLKGALPDTRAYDGCQHVELWTRPDSPGTVWVYETWESKEHQAKYFAWRLETGLMDAIGPFMAGEPKVMWLDDHAF